MICLPSGYEGMPWHLHPFSLRVLQEWLLGLISDDQFLRLFHYPNSSYIQLSECLVNSGIT